MKELLLDNIWDATSALGSLLAVIAAIWLADRARRDSIQRDIATIYGLIVLAGGLRDIYTGRAARGAKPDATDPGMLNAFGEITRLVEAVVITSLPTRETADAFMVIATRLQMIAAGARLTVSGAAPHSAIVEQCTEAAVSMTQQIERLEGEIFLLKHPLRVKIARAIAKLWLRVRS